MPWRSHMHHAHAPPQHPGYAPYRHQGRDYGITLNYNSGLAGSRMLGTGPKVQGQTVPLAGVAVSERGSSIRAVCVAKTAASLIAANPGSCASNTTCNFSPTLLLQL